MGAGIVEVDPGSLQISMKGGRGGSGKLLCFGLPDTARVVGGISNPFQSHFSLAMSSSNNFDTSANILYNAFQLLEVKENGDEVDSL